MTERLNRMYKKGLMKDTMTLNHFLIQGESEFIPLLNEAQEDKILNDVYDENLPLLTIKNTVLFPGVVLPITAGRDKSIKLLKDAQNNNKTLAVITQKDFNVEEPNKEDLYEIGTVAKIIKMLSMPDGSSTVIIQGLRRFKLEEITEKEPYYTAKIALLEEQIPTKKNKEFLNLVDTIRETAIQIVKENPLLPSDATFALKNIEGKNLFINFVISNMEISVVEKQELLEINNLKERAQKALKHLHLELQKLSIRNDIHSKVRDDIDQQQKEYFLHQQIKTIQEELGGISIDDEIEEMNLAAKNKKWSKETKDHFEKELNRLKRMNPQVPEHSIQRNYLELFLELPWGKFSKDNFDLKRAEKILNKDHFGLDDIKERILEHLAVLKLKNNMKSPILCLFGPPGVGKTSLGKSIAEALGRKYIRISLGGLHDESEIRGHRKTYIGALPGRIIQSIKKAGTSNPVFVLDEIDKLGRGNHGDPSSALLEVLDPEQNHSFYDNFLEQGYDLSKVMFIATANSLATIQPALRDRMEIINISGYTLEEKTEIGLKHLLPKQIQEHGITKKDISIGKKELQYVIQSYTRESGVRNLDKRIAKLVRHVALQIAKENEYETRISKEKIVEVLGVPRERDLAEKFKVPGVVTGLAWTSVGGDILFIESIIHQGSGKLSITGNLGNVMKESATIALEYIKTHYKKFGIESGIFEKTDVHIHVPEGATPKDGPSAGVTMLTSLVSSFSKRKVRDKIAMTGEITLRGKVLAVGGIKEKILAAKRAGIKEILLSVENKKDISEIKEEYLKGLSFHYVQDMEEVIRWALK